MKIDVRNIIKTFPAALCLEFIGTDGNSTQHPKYGTNKLTLSQFRNSTGGFKQQLYRNIIECLQYEVDCIMDGTLYQECLDEPLVKSPYMKMFWGKDIDGMHELNRRMKYPELMEYTDKVFKELTEKLNQAMSSAGSIESKMPYKSQFVLEEVIQRVKVWEESV
jgi:hypothetical protein